MTVLAGPGSGRGGAEGAGRWRGRLRQLLLVVLLNVPTVSFGLAMGWVSLASGEGGEFGAGGEGEGVGEGEGEGEGEGRVDARVVAGAASTFLAALVGVPLSARALQAGRRVALLAASAAFAMCWTLKLVGGGWWVVVGRVFAGLGSDISWAAAPLMAKEMCEKKVGGAAVASMVLAHNIGFLLMYVAADIGMDYRAVLWCCLGLSVVHCIVFPFMPESPAFLAAKGKEKEARASLAWLRGTQPDSPELSRELEALPPVEDLNSNPVQIVRDMLSDRRRRRAFVISFIAVVGQESCGVLALMQFAERLFVVAQGEAGGAGGAGGAGVGSWLPVVSPARCAVVLGTAQLIASAFALYLVERVGRRGLLVSTSFLTGGLLGAGAALVRWSGGGVGAAAALGGAVAADSLGMQPVPYALLADMFTYQYRGCAMLLVSAGVSLGNALEVVVLPLAMEGWGAGGGLALSAGLTLLYAVFVAATVPETRGLEPHQVYDIICPPRPAAPAQATVECGVKDKCDETESTKI